MRFTRFQDLRCPACARELLENAYELACTGCGAGYPQDGGMPVLLRDRERHRRAIAELDAEVRRRRWTTIQLSAVTLTWLPAERRRVLADTGIAHGWTVLDHCTGDGANLPLLARLVGPHGTLVGMDLSTLGLKRARRLATRKRIDVDLHQADPLALPYADGAFDAVVHYSTLHRTLLRSAPRKRRVLEEILRVTRAGGVIVLLDEGREDHPHASAWRSALLARDGSSDARTPLDVRSAETPAEVRSRMRGALHELHVRKPAVTASDRARRARGRVA